MKPKATAVILFAAFCQIAACAVARPVDCAASEDTPAKPTAADATSGRERIPFKARPFNLHQVRLLDGPFKDAQERDRKYLISLDPERFLFNFRKNVGLPSPSKPYGGWDVPKSEQRGAMLGHYLTACAQMYASTGDIEFKRGVDYIIGELAKCQDASLGGKFNAGYLSAFPESFIERVEKRQNVWGGGMPCTKSEPPAKPGA